MRNYYIVVGGEKYTAVKVKEPESGIYRQDKKLYQHRIEKGEIRLARTDGTPVDYTYLTQHNAKDCPDVPGPGTTEEEARRGALWMGEYYTLRDILIFFSDGLLARETQRLHVVPVPQAGGMQWQLINGGNASAADGPFVFVTMPGGTIRVGNDVVGGGGRAHNSVSQGMLFVRYAGEVVFNQGVLEQWNNRSGTYLPLADLNHQAGLDPNKFVPHHGA